LQAKREKRQNVRVVKYRLAVKKFMGEVIKFPRKCLLCDEYIEKEFEQIIGLSIPEVSICEECLQKCCEQSRDNFGVEE
jgi:hypothetical protein